MDMKRTLIIGAGGQLGSSLLKVISNSVGAGHKTNIEIDITDMDALSKLFQETHPDIVINAAAYTNVDKCEIEKSKAYRINAKAVMNIVKLCRHENVKMVHISTDYVFRGDKGMYKEEDEPDPINYYGFTKAIGDAFALSYDNSLIIRTSGIFGKSSNFPIFVYDKLSNGEKISVIDGYYSPIHANLLAKGIASVMLDYNGILNIAGERISRYDLAMRIAKTFGFNDHLVERVSKIDSMIAARPYDSSLDITRAKQIIDFDFYSIDANLKEMVKA